MVPTPTQLPAPIIPDRPPSPAEGESEEDPVVALARKRFGVATLRPWQRFVVGESLDTLLGTPGAPGSCRAPGWSRGRIVVLPTGAGKSLCFQLPALLAPGPSLVVFPLRALVSDQEKKLRALGIPLAVLRGGEDRVMQRREEAAIAAGVPIILATPEAALSPRGRRVLAGAGIAHFVIDEAHCVSEWGEGFRPAYLELGDLIAQLAPRLASAFTATASPRILAAIRRILFAGAEVPVLAGNPDRENIYYSVKRSLSRGRALVELCANERRPMVVFCGTREGAEDALRSIRRALPRVAARFYHAGLPKDARAALEDWFLGSPDGILFSTCAYGMGIDKPDIRTVVHLRPSPSIEAYLQETGRAGRDGAPSRAIMIADPRDEALARARGPTTTAPEELARRRARALVAAALRGESCLREAYLELLGFAIDACAGCDACAGVPSADLLPGILSTIAHHGRRFTRRSVLSFLAGCPPPGEAGALAGQLAGAGSLGSWGAEHREEALDALIDAGFLELPRPRLPGTGEARLRLGEAGRGLLAGECAV